MPGNDDDNLDDHVDEIHNEIRELRHNRGVLKGQITRLWSFLDKPENLDKTFEIQQRLLKIEKFFDQFDHIQTRLEYLDATEKDQRQELENNFYSVINKCNDLLTRAQIQRQIPPPQQNPQQPDTQTQTQNLVTGLKLPPIKLPEFSGEYSNWAAFHDAFLHLIHNNQQLTNVQRICHLKSCLRGTALKQVENLENTDINYEVAWQLLVERYDNKRITINDHITSILNLPKLGRNCSFTLRDLTDQVHQHVTALEKLGVPTKGWEVVLVCTISNKLENSINLEWEDTLTKNELPTYENFRKFLTRKCSAHENVYKSQAQKSHTLTNTNTHTSRNTHNQITNFSQRNVPNTQNTNSHQNTHNTHHNIHNTRNCYAITQSNYQNQAGSTDITMTCNFCKESHFIYQCSRFLNLNPDERYAEVRKLNLCTNCLRPGHSKFYCRSRKCRKCNNNHNTLLHKDTQSHSRPIQTNAVTLSQQASTHTQYQLASTPPVTAVASSEYCSTDKQAGIQTIMHVQGAHNNFDHKTDSHIVLLSTAEIYISDNLGNIHKCRALLDSGSQSSLITKDLCNQLQLDCQNINIPIAGVNQNVINIIEKTHATISSRYNEYKVNLSFLILNDITQNIPPITLNNSNSLLPKDIQVTNLADPQYYKSRKIDMLLGADIFYELILPNQIKLGRNLPTLQETVFGYILTGKINTYANANNRTLSCNFIKISNEQLDENITKFWELEEIPKKRFLNSDEQYCEKYFQETTTRAEDGRFIVKLPLKDPNQNFGETIKIAQKRLGYLENKFIRNIELKIEYVKFMQEYSDLGHMTLINNPKYIDSSSYILPHHAVIKQSSTTTKCRVVFDGSARANSESFSLNDNLFIGYCVQDELFNIILRFRLRKYVLNADVKMMFRQIWVHPEHRKYQQILWRFSDQESVNLYSLNTVTYGTACAPFLAQRTLFEIALQNEKEFPETCKIIKNSFYMDDLLASFDTIEEALNIFREITNMLKQYGFDLRKWSSNEVEILKSILSNGDNSDKLVEFHEDKQLKTLGIVWHPGTDSFTYSVNLELNNFNQTLTKRSALAIVAKIFDPLGLIGPAVITVKLFIQELWRQGLSWDEPLPNNFCEWFHAFISQLQEINLINIPRHVTSVINKGIELHCFCDASERAYGACIYILSADHDNKLTSHLLCAKSKVAPQKKCTLPRLELLSAHLLAKLTSTTITALNIDISNVFYYTDSTIVLAWLRVDPSRLKTFIANRVSQINELTNINYWKHVSSENNAADIISRGIEASKLKTLDFWWHGPEFLTNKNLVPSSIIIQFPNDLPELKVEKPIILASQKADFDLFTRYSCLEKLKRITAYCLRFKQAGLKQTRSKYLTVEELSYSMNCLIRVAQSQVFSNDIRTLKSGKKLHSSNIISLNPFLDENEILRVGGRLRHSDLTFENKHPIILPKKHPLTLLIIRYYHYKYLHAGVQNLLSIIRLQFWPIDSKTLIKQVVRKCIVCFRVNPKPPDILMGDLPSTRVKPSRPFSITGVDYAGPLIIKSGSIRKPTPIKTYICIFVCLATRAIHIDLAYDLSTESFLNVLKRFISRRGKPSEIHSDNGSNFIGASNYFLELHKLLQMDEHNERVSNYLARDNITFKQIPAHSPHMGGIWEAAVKSAKFHLRRTLGNAYLNHEEMYTLLTQIEACLNSRPLSPMSSDPNDYIPLTPAHFLIGSSLAALPESDLQHLPMNRLNRYQLMTQLYQGFWTRWSREYLTELQRRQKWHKHSDSSPKVGDLVLLIEDNSPPLKWPMGRITDLHPGADSTVRVVSVKLPSGTVVKRTVKKLCVIPLED